jgi:mono/diheme cytochrome c family protein
VAARESGYAAHVGEDPSDGNGLAFFLCAMWGGVRPACRRAAPVLPVLLWACLLAGPTRGTPIPPGERVDFRRDLQPIFDASCTKCHGATRQRSQLRLDSPSFALHGGVMGPVIVPGDSARSRLVQLLAEPDPASKMPQPASAPALSPEKIQLIRRWIDQGAPWPASQDDARYEPHWAYQEPVRPRPPAVQNAGWVRNPIDAFVLARLEREGLSPSPEAPRATLIRRVSLDLTGLPPSLAEVDAFLADTRPDAYERVVDRLLASPRYGERWARSWLDLVRYADTDGGSWDRRRSMWPYRDWVIRALNEDMPFTRFTIEQIAGDLLPDPTPDQMVAAGMHANTTLNQEDGVDADEVRWESLTDRTDTTATVWLGATLGCARCHNHKYDPFTQKDYYRFLAFFDHADVFEYELPRLPDPARAGKPALTSVVKEHPEGMATTYVRVRGSFPRKGELVTAGTPRALHPMRRGWPMNRLGLAYWLVDDDNPLTARVVVNRYWGELFGRALAETAEDLGTQGQRPSHPELLDWLATEFVRGGWSMKAIQRTMVTSASYRQSSRATPGLLERDPGNVLLARGPRFRLDAETIRDVALAASGLLSPRIGGPSVFPPSPDDHGFVPNNKGAVVWTASAGEDAHRRGLYTFWRRTAPYPAFTTFDAPSREATTVRRPRTNTPLQALSALNDPAFVDAARGLARRIVREAPPDPATRAAYGFRLCVARSPEPAELQLLAAGFLRERDHFATDARAARELLGADGPPIDGPDLPDLAAWTVVANALLNLDETLTKE